MKGFSATCAKADPLDALVYIVWHCGTGCARLRDDTISIQTNTPFIIRLTGARCRDPGEHFSLSVCLQETSKADLSLTSTLLLPHLQFFKYFPHSLISDRAFFCIAVKW